MTMFLTIAVIILIFVVIFQIAKASEYVSILKGEEVSRRQNNKINGFLMVAFLVLGMIGVWYCNKLYFGKTLMAQPSASVEGAERGFYVMDHHRYYRHRICCYTGYPVSGSHINTRTATARFSISRIIINSKFYGPLFQPLY
jgi:hypothetical protein